MMTLPHPIINHAGKQAWVAAIGWHPCGSMRARMHACGLQLKDLLLAGSRLLMGDHDQGQDGPGAHQIVCTKQKGPLGINLVCN